METYTFYQTQACNFWEDTYERDQDSRCHTWLGMERELAALQESDLRAMHTIEAAIDDAIIEHAALDCILNAFLERTIIEAKDLDGIRTNDLENFEHQYAQELHILYHEEGANYDTDWETFVEDEFDKFSNPNRISYIR